MADKNYGLSPVVDDVEERNKPTRERAKLDRYINLAGIINFGLVSQLGWQPMGYVLPIIMVNGGPAAFVWGLVLAAIGSLGVAASLAEMASMDPHVGAQYRWSAGFARKSPEFWGLLQGWITVFAWIVNVAPNLMVLSQTVQGLIKFHDESYVAERWHGTLLMIAFLATSVLCNFFLRRILGVLETLGGMCHILFFMVIVTILTTLARRSTPAFVFKTLVSDISGWNNPGISWNLGVAPLIIGLVNCDGVTHMIDETKNPRKRVPRTMLIAVGGNAIMSIIMAIVLLFCIGDLEKTLSAPLPILEIYYQATKSKATATIMLVMTAFCVVVSMFNITASVTRLTWAFARDNGLPFHAFFSQVHPKLRIPLQALGLVSVVLAILSLLNIGSTVALAAFLSIPTVALCLSYIIPITLLTIRKLKNDHPRYGPFRLGRWGLPINIWAIVFLLYCLIWTPFPTMYPIDAENMNYAGPITVAVILLALLDWFTSGNRRFKIPNRDFNNIELYDKQEREERERKR